MGAALLAFQHAQSSSKNSSTDETSLELSLSYYDRRFENNDNDRVQSGAGVVMRHVHGLVDNKFSVGAAAYGAQKLFTSGRVTEDLLPVADGALQSFALLGEAYVEYRPTKTLKLTAGRTRHRSLLLRSKTRVLASTFQGIGANWEPDKQIQVYAHRFSKWSPRARDSFESFQTNVSAPGAINHIWIAGLDVSTSLVILGDLRMQMEYLEANDYLRKAILVASIDRPFSEQLALSLEAGLASSHDAGTLFVDGANDDLDSDPFSQTQRLDHEGVGAYLALSLTTAHHRFGVTHSRFADPWLEDSFANDHGTTPFPTKTYGPELTNKNESIWMLEYQYSATSKLFQGLKTNLAVASGKHAENSVSADIGLAQESWVEFDIEYQSPRWKSLHARLRYRQYDSSIDGSVTGVKDDREEWRLNVSYRHSF